MMDWKWTRLDEDIEGEDRSLYFSRRVRRAPRGWIEDQYWEDSPFFVSDAFWALINALRCWAFGHVMEAEVFGTDENDLQPDRLECDRCERHWTSPPMETPGSEE